MKLSIIIPLYNEARQILDTLKELSSLPFPSYVSSVEIVVIDDGSTDDSHAIVKGYQTANDHIALVRHEKNKGKGAAIVSGIEQASGDIIVIQDADMELLPSDICSMLEAMQSLQVAFINGSRYLAGVNRPLFSFWRYVINQFFTLLTSITVNVKLTDMACGYKMFRKELIQDITIREQRFGFEAELMIKAIRKLGYRQIAEVPVHYSPRNVQEGKKIRNSDAWQILNAILKYGFLRMP
jgi:glycosyltransferase involved in cell wall biosynthesis